MSILTPAEKGELHARRDYARYLGWESQEEMIIEGELCHRPNSNYHWRPYSKEELTRMLLAERLNKKGVHHE